MLNTESVLIRSPHEALSKLVNGKEEVEVIDSRVSAAMDTGNGCKIVLFFDDLGAAGPVREVRLLPEKDGGQVEPHVATATMRKLALYIQFARGAIQWKHGDAVAALHALRGAGATRRGLGDDLYRIIGNQYAALVKEGTPHPVKAIGELNNVDISTASRWIKEARQRGLVST